MPVSPVWEVCKVCGHTYLVETDTCIVINTLKTNRTDAPTPTYYHNHFPAWSTSGIVLPGNTFLLPCLLLYGPDIKTSNCQKELIISDRVPAHIVSMLSGPQPFERNPVIHLSV